MKRLIKLVLVGFVLIALGVLIAYSALNHQRILSKNVKDAQTDTLWLVNESEGSDLVASDNDSLNYFKANIKKKEGHFELSELIEEWRQHGYPPYFAGLYKVSAYQYIMGLTDLSQDIIDEVSNLLIAPENIQFVSSPYSYNELLAAHDRLDHTLIDVLGNDLHSHVHGYGIAYNKTINLNTNPHRWGLSIHVDWGFEDEIEYLVKSYYGDKIIRVTPSDRPDLELD